MKYVCTCEYIMAVYALIRLDISNCIGRGRFLRRCSVSYSRMKLRLSLSLKIEHTWH